MDQMLAARALDFATREFLVTDEMLNAMRTLKFEVGHKFSPLTPASLGQRHGARNHPKPAIPEWPLVKVSIIAGSAFPVTARMGDFHELSARPIEPGKGLGAAFDRARFGLRGTKSRARASHKSSHN